MNCHHMKDDNRSMKDDNRNRKDVYVPIIPSETNLGMFSEDKKCLLRHFLLDRFFRFFL